MWKEIKMNKHLNVNTLKTLTQIAQEVDGEGHINYISRLMLMASISKDTSLTCFIEATTDLIVADIVQEFIIQGFKASYDKRTPTVYGITVSWE